jgi:hypothetical protein
VFNISSETASRPQSVSLKSPRTSRAPSRAAKTPKWFANSMPDLASFLDNIQRITAYTHRDTVSQTIITDILTHVDSISQTILAVETEQTGVFKRKLVIWMVGMIKGYVDIITTRMDLCFNEKGSRLLRLNEMSPLRILNYSRYASI